PDRVGAEAHGHQQDHRDAGEELAPDVPVPDRLQQGFAHGATGDEESVTPAPSRRARSSRMRSRSPRRATPVTASAPALRTSSGGDAIERSEMRVTWATASTSRPRVRFSTSTTTTRL